MKLKNVLIVVKDIEKSRKFQGFTVGYPDGSVSPCLSKHYYFKESDVENNIIAAYRLFDQDESLLQTLFEKQNYSY